MDTEQVDNPIGPVIDAEAPPADLPAPDGAEEAAGDDAAAAADGTFADVAAKQDGAEACRVRAAHEPDALEDSLQRGVDVIRVLCAEVDQADAAAREDSPHGRACKAMMEDMTWELERLSEKIEIMAARDDSVVQITFAGAQRKRRVGWANLMETGIELWNEASDLVMIYKLWNEGFVKLFLAAALAMALHLLARIVLAARQWSEIDQGKRCSFLWGALVYMIEPNNGQRLMKKALKDKAEGGMVFDPTFGGYVHVDKDAVAVKAQNDHTAGKTQVRTTALMLGTEDVPEFAIQVIYLSLSAAEDLDLTFALATAGTLVHMVQQGWEAWATQRRLAELERIAEGRDKSFEKTDGTTTAWGTPTMTTTDDDVEEFARKYGEVVRSVSLADCRLITEAAVESLARHCPNLRSLDLFAWLCEALPEVADVGIQAIADNCHQLCSLNLTGCSNLTDVGIRAIAEGCKLVSLNLYGCSEVTDVGLRAIAQGCKQLTLLDLAGCRKVTDDGLTAIAETCKQLTSLNLQSCDKLTDGGVQAIAEGCKQLSSLDLGLCSQATDGWLRAIGENCKQLSSLKLFDCKKVTDVGIQAIAEGCQQLSSLDVRKCSAVTDDGIGRVKAALPACDVKR
jgi:hypothetical protein